MTRTSGSPDPRTAGASVADDSDVPSNKGSYPESTICRSTLSLRPRAWSQSHERFRTAAAKRGRSCESERSPGFMKSVGYVAVRCHVQVGRHVRRAEKTSVVANIRSRVRRTRDRGRRRADERRQTGGFADRWASRPDPLDVVSQRLPPADACEARCGRPRKDRSNAEFFQDEEGHLGRSGIVLGERCRRRARTATCTRRPDSGQSSIAPSVSARVPGGMLVALGVLHGKAHHEGADGRDAAAGSPEHPSTRGAAALDGCRHWRRDAVGPHDDSRSQPGTGRGES